MGPAIIRQPSLNLMRALRTRPSAAATALVMASELGAASVIDRLRTGSSNATLERSQVAALNAALDAALLRLLDAWRAAVLTAVAPYMIIGVVTCVFVVGDPNYLLYHVCKALLDPPASYPPP